MVRAAIADFSRLFTQYVTNYLQNRALKKLQRELGLLARKLSKEEIQPLVDALFAMPKTHSSQTVPLAKVITTLLSPAPADDTRARELLRIFQENPYKENRLIGSAATRGTRSSKGFDLLFT